MILKFSGCDAAGGVCTTTSADVTPITIEEYSDPTIEQERDAFADGKIDFYRVNSSGGGFARNFGGMAKKHGLYFHNRLFTSKENPIQQLELDLSRNTADAYSFAIFPEGICFAVGRIANSVGMQARVSSKNRESIVFTERYKRATT